MPALKTAGGTGGAAYAGLPSIPLSMAFTRDIKASSLKPSNVRDGTMIRPFKLDTHPPLRVYPRVNPQRRMRSEEHTSELQSRVDLVCRLLLEKKKKKK